MPYEDSLFPDMRPRPRKAQPIGATKNTHVNWTPLSDKKSAVLEAWVADGTVKRCVRQTTNPHATLYLDHSNLEEYVRLEIDGAVQWFRQRPVAKSVKPLKSST